MFNIQKNMKINNGNIETISITSNDNYKTLDLKENYILINETKNKENKIEKIFKNSILTTDIGIKTESFSKIVILATMIAIIGIYITYLFCKI